MFAQVVDAGTTRHLLRQILMNNSSYRPFPPLSPCFYIAEGVAQRAFSTKATEFKNKFPNFPYNVVEKSKEDIKNFLKTGSLPTIKYVIPEGAQAKWDALAEDMESKLDSNAAKINKEIAAWNDERLKESGTSYAFERRNPGVCRHPFFRHNLNFH